MVGTLAYYKLAMICSLFVRNWGNLLYSKLAFGAQAAVNRRLWSTAKVSDVSRDWEGNVNWIYTRRQIPCTVHSPQIVSLKVLSISLRLVSMSSSVLYSRFTLSLLCVCCSRRRSSKYQISTYHLIDRRKGVPITDSAEILMALLMARSAADLNWSIPSEGPRIIIAPKNLQPFWVPRQQWQQVPSKSQWYWCR